LRNTSISLEKCPLSFPLGLWLGHFDPLGDDSSSFGTLRIVIGVFIFLFGFLVNKHADMLLARLRKPGETDYKIPHGGIFNYTSGPIFSFFIFSLSHALFHQFILNNYFLFEFCKYELRASFQQKFSTPP